MSDMGVVNLAGLGAEEGKCGRGEGRGSGGRHRGMHGHRVGAKQRLGWRAMSLQS